MELKELRDKRVISTVAPSSGSVVLSALQIFSGFDGSAQEDDPAINVTTHRRRFFIPSTTQADGSDRIDQVRLRSAGHLG